MGVVIFQRVSSNNNNDIEEATRGEGPGFIRFLLLFYGARGGRLTYGLANSVCVTTRCNITSTYLPSYYYLSAHYVLKECKRHLFTTITLLKTR